MTDDVSKQVLTGLLNTIELLHDAVLLTYERQLALEDRLRKLEKFEHEVRLTNKLKEEISW